MSFRTLVLAEVVTDPTITRKWQQGTGIDFRKKRLSKMPKTRTKFQISLKTSCVNDGSS